MGVEEELLRDSPAGFLLTTIHQFSHPDIFPSLRGKAKPKAFLRRSVSMAAAIPF